MQSHFILFITTNIYEKSRENNCVPSEKISTHCTEVRFASFLSGEFTTMTVMNPPERKLEKRTSVHCGQGVLRRYIHSKVPFNFSPLEVMTFVNKNNICSLIDNVFAN